MENIIRLQSKDTFYSGFIYFTSFFNYNTKGDDFRKVQINGVKVRVGSSLGYKDIC